MPRTFFLMTAALICTLSVVHGQTLAAPPETPSQTASPTPKPASSADQRSAAALALSSEPMLDEGSAQRLQDALKRYDDVAASGGYPVIPTDAKFALGIAGANDELLRKRLVMSGDLAASESSGPFNTQLADGVKRFQARHGLAATGTVTPRTMAMLNVPVEKRIGQLQASLERVKNMGFGFGARYVVVNIPAAFAEAVENDRVVRRYRVIVGKTEKPSPTLTAEISNVNLNPTWTVPASITKNEISAHMRKDPGYLERMHMQLLDSRDAVVDPASVDWSAGKTPNVTVRQEQGAWNALGQVRIDMPNSYSVYMHDTNQKNLFSDDYRFDSHGCARVDNVRDLAAWLLQDMPQWTRAAIDETIASGARQDVKLTKKVPVAWVYLTGWVTRDQVVHFRHDIYDQDTQLLEASAEEKSFFEQASGRAGTVVR